MAGDPAQMPTHSISQQVINETIHVKTRRGKWAQWGGPVGQACQVWRHTGWTSILILVLKKGLFTARSQTRGRVGRKANQEGGSCSQGGTMVAEVQGGGAGSR